MPGPIVTEELMTVSSANPWAGPLAFLANRRGWNIGFRTAHIAAMGVLLGGHAFDVPSQRLLPVLACTVATGLVLAGLESGMGLLWLHMGCGLTTLAKLALLATIPFLWDYRLPILLVVVVLASVGSHMPARYRYYSVLYRRVFRCRGGPVAEANSE
jgi:biotin transporter BioY